MAFCQYCGKELKDNAKFCGGCGKEINNANKQETTQENTVENNRDFSISQSVINQLSERYKINGIIWIAVAIIQLILGLVVNWVCLIVGILNLISAIQDINFSKSILTTHVGIIDRVKPLTGPIIVLIYNLIFGGILGVAGSIYYLVGIRNFVLNNENELRVLEMQA